MNVASFLHLSSSLQSVELQLGGDLESCVLCISCCTSSTTTDREKREREREKETVGGGGGGG